MFWGVLDQPGSMEKPQIVCQVTFSQTLLFEPPGAHSSATGMNVWVPKVVGVFVSLVAAKVAGNMATTSLGQCGR